MDDHDARPTQRSADSPVCARIVPVLESTESDIGKAGAKRLRRESQPQTDSGEDDSSPFDTSLNFGATIREPGSGDEGDSAFEDDSSSTCTVDLNDVRYMKIGSRKYISMLGAYHWAPSDEKHRESLDICHYVDTILLPGELYLAPVGEHDVLDIGTGTGIWAMDFADKHPEASVIGTDISLIQPEWVPANLHFELHDCNREWYFRQCFDYIHVRRMYGSIDDWPAFMEKGYKNLKPGGYIESHEVSVRFESDDESVENGGCLERWGKMFKEAGDRTGRSFTIVEDDTQTISMEGAGFTNIEAREFKLNRALQNQIPIGGWPQDRKLRDAGCYTRRAYDNDLEGLALYLATEVLGWCESKAYTLATDVRRTLRSSQVHAYVRLKVVYGQKPSST
ncbi:Fc.00g056210.m01.CDS01 [Cosmosporella sp. VM-42]